MNNIKFDFVNLKPITSNHAIKKGRNGRSYKSDKAVKFEQRILLEALKKRVEIYDFENAYSVFDHFLKANIVIYMPSNKLITKKGYISSKSLDLDNCLKYLIDGIFKSFKKIDDSAICKIDAEKRPSKDTDYHIEVELVRHDMNEWDI